MIRYGGVLGDYLEELATKGFTVRISNDCVYPKIAIEVECDYALVVNWIDHYDLPNENAFIREIQRIIDEIEE